MSISELAISQFAELLFRSQVSRHFVEHLTVCNALLLQDAVKSMLDQYSKSEHAFDIDAEPEPVPEECAAAWVGDGVAEEDVVDDGFGPVGLDDECDDDLDNGWQQLIHTLYCCS